MEFKGTKDKWDLRSYTRGNNLYSNTYVIKNGLFKEHDANALLISKAPELLKMLRVILELSEGNLKLGTDISLEEYYTEFEEAKELIKQATTL